MSDAPSLHRDPVCGQPVDPLRARAVGIWGSRTYYFCSAEHKAEFARDPNVYLARGPAGAPVRATTPEPSPAPTRRRTPTAGPVPSPSPIPSSSGPGAREETPVMEGRPTLATPTPMRVADDLSGPLEPPRSRAGRYVALIGLAALALAAAWLATHR